MGSGEAESACVVRCLGYDIAARLVRRPGARGRILFINGAIATTSSLRWIEKGLADFEIASFDFPHLGRSAALNLGRPATDPEGDAAIVLTVIARLEPDYVAAISWGGTAALLALAQRPPGVRRAVLAGYSLGVTAAMRSLGARLLTLIGTDNAAAARLVVGELGERLSPRLQAIYLDYFLGLGSAPIEDIAAHIRRVMALDIGRYLDRLRAVDIPLLCLNGALDRFTAPGAIRPIGAYVAEAEFAEIPGARHFLTNESLGVARLVAEAVGSFFSRETVAVPAL